LGDRVKPPTAQKTKVKAPAPAKGDAKGAQVVDDDEDGKAEAKGKSWRDKLKLPAFLARKKKSADGEDEDSAAEADDKEESDGGGKGKGWAERLNLKLPAFLSRKKKSEDGEEEEKESSAEADGEAGEEGEEGAGADKRRKQLIAAAAGGLVLLVGMIGGGAWWYLSSGSSEAKKVAAGAPAAVEGQKKGSRIAVALPPAPGSLNTLVAPVPGKAAVAPAAPGAARAGVQSGQPQTTVPAGAPSATAPPPRYAAKAGDVGGPFGGVVDPLGSALNVVGGRASGQGPGIVVPAVTSITVGRLPDQPSTASDALPATPDQRLVEKKQGLPGPLPMAGKDGTVAWQLYARPNKIGEGPRVAIMIVGVGQSRAASLAAITKLPAEVTMVLDPYAKDLSDWVVRSRLAGHEVMLGLPMESDRFPVYDAGPMALDTALSADDNIKRLELVLSQVSGYTGVVTIMGSRFGTSEALLTPVLEALKARGLMLATTGPQGALATPKVAAKVGLPRVISDITLDEEPSRLAIEAKLNELELLVRQRTVAVAAAHPHPATIERLINWTTTLKQKKVALVPVSALAKSAATPQKK
jgi:polysaccharide deacetylase 2 family uncharacterized protein YibQ